MYDYVPIVNVQNLENFEKRKALENLGLSERDIIIISKQFSWKSLRLAIEDIKTYCKTVGNKAAFLTSRAQDYKQRYA